jgi:hypothetical protein
LDDSILFSFSSGKMGISITSEGVLGPSQYLLSCKINTPWAFLSLAILPSKLSGFSPYETGKKGLSNFF